MKRYQCVLVDSTLNETTFEETDRFPKADIELVDVIRNLGEHDLSIEVFDTETNTLVWPEDVLYRYATIEDFKQGNVEPNL